jgi:hypothetical protein
MSSGRWAPVPRSTSRWLLPTTPRHAATSSVRIYHPVTIKGLMGWEAARALASLGGFHLLPGRADIPSDVTGLLSANDVAYRSLALARANHPSRFLALLLDRSFECSGVAKMAFDEAGRAALAREATAITDASHFFTEAVQPSRLQKAVDGLLVLEPVQWLPRILPWRLPGQVAYAVGAYSRSKSAGSNGEAAAHGDFAPWNLLRIKGGWVLLDWEHSSASRPPFFDLWHYLLQSHTLLGYPSTKDLIAALRGSPGWVREALVEYSRGCGRSSEQAIDYLDAYIEASSDQLAGQSKNERRGIDERMRLRQEISELRL